MVMKATGHAILALKTKTKVQTRTRTQMQMKTQTQTQTKTQTNEDEDEDEDEDDIPLHYPEDHPEDDPAPEGLTREVHESMDGRPCDEHGNFLPPNTPPTPPPAPPPDDWSPYDSRLEFQTAELLYMRMQTSAGFIDELMNLWAASLLKHHDTGPYPHHTKLYQKIDSTILGDVKWETFDMSYTGPMPEHNVPGWMKAKYDVWFRDPRAVVRNILANPRV
ncbi:hypothetical protein A0H81_02651 [Grifola frondosa]|uniref:Uncharacterized protein n=1 Tax=Grifola frondosa TaxID=5627 RepID=A0A1C7MN71_GRIFR|nr:hypothetical protein A0H81_02651 [Grifola frondosa]